VDQSLPTRPGWSFEPKWDGFRAIIRAGNDYCVRSRRGRPSFHRLCARMLNHDASVPVALVLLDVLEPDGESRLHLPYLERRELLEDTYFRFLTRTDDQLRSALDAYDMREATG
jgi:ATP-dependent DNA ligase